ncbi:MAG TPA: papain-like cysteine protease family protein [Myxococcales bacterium]|nr:papain-like cysteine protease family protein [Myxococcales bacterium]
MTSIPSSLPVHAPQTVPEAPAPPAQPAPPQQAAPGIDVFQRAAVDYSAITGTAPPVKQDTFNDCGEAAVATIVKQLGGKNAGADPSQIVRELRSMFDRDGNGTTPTEMLDMLAHQGLSATRGTTNFDQGAADAALANGGRVMVLADSHQLRPEGSNSQQVGAAHWVVLDGKDAQGRYTVSDPLDGSRYSVDMPHLAKAMDASWLSHGGGGMLVVQPAGAGKSDQQVVAEDQIRAGVAGKEPGIGSNGARLGDEPAQQ